MWSAGKTAAAIGADLGGISRSAVLGKVFRLRLVAQDDVPADAPARRRAGKAKPIQPQPTKCKTLLELTNECCRWPHGDLGGRRFFFCGVPEADLARGIPYCPRHMQRAYLIPPSLLTPLHKLKLIVSGGQNKAKGVKGARGAKNAKGASSLLRSFPGSGDPSPASALRENNTKRRFG
jgi:GcrA cell cycle regulator